MQLQAVEITLVLIMGILVIGWLAVMVYATIEIKRRKQKNATG